MVNFIKYPKVNSDSNDPTLYGDIITHCKSYKNFIDSSRYTSAHEISHGIANEIRLQSGDWEGKNGFYVGQDKSILLNEPKIRKSQITEFIPSELRSARYNLYITGQSEWDDKPLYVYDEGVAYTNGTWAAIELKEKENYTEGTIVDGQIEFIPYMAAVLMTADKYAKLDQDLIDFSRWLFRHASNAYFRCLKNFAPFDVQDNLWKIMKTGSVYDTHRSFLKDKIGYVFPDGEIPEDDPDDQPIDWNI